MGRRHGRNRFGSIARVSCHLAEGYLRPRRRTRGRKYGCDLRKPAQTAAALVKARLPQGLADRDADEIAGICRNPELG
jgi:hypothetical protein